jgi:hypothetical protein
MLFPPCTQTTIKKFQRSKVAEYFIEVHSISAAVKVISPQACDHVSDSEDETVKSQEIAEITSVTILFISRGSTFTVDI